MFLTFNQPDKKQNLTENNKKVIKEMETFDIDNPQWSAATNYVEAFTNVPLNRLYNKGIHSVSD